MLKMMKAVSDPRTDLTQFLELVIMWHCAGDVPMNRVSTSKFIEDDNYPNFLQSVYFWCHEFGLEIPSHSSIVKALYELYDEEETT